MPQEKLGKIKESPIALVGGGTGGHIFPLVAVAEELSNRSVQFFFIGSKNGLEREVVEGRGWSFAAVSAGKWRRYHTFSGWLSNISDLFRSGYGFFQAVKMLRRRRVKVLLSKGGYVALPVVLAAKFCGCRVLVHESDAVMGLTNRISAKVADRVLTAFNPSVYPAHNAKYRQIGIPVRSSLQQAAKLKAPAKSRPLLLILPGSQGSSAINSLVEAALPNLLATCDVVHLAGRAEYERFAALKNDETKRLGSLAKHYKPYAFIDRELPYYFQTADLLVARASATTLAEAALFKRAAYLVPLPSAAGDHQNANADRLQAINAVVVRQESRLTPEQFSEDVSELLGNPERLHALGEALHHYFSSDTVLTAVMEELNV